MATNPTIASPQQGPVLITGATGFLGQHLALDLCERGYTVKALIRNPQSAAAQALPDSVQRVRGDILDPSSIASAISGCVGLFHCAGKVSRDPEDALQMHEVHVTGTQNCLEAARQAGLRRCVIAGTSGTIGVSENEDHIADESHDPPFELINRWPYYRSKYYAEQVLKRFASDPMELISVHPSLLLGPGDLHGSSSGDVRRYLERPLPVAPTGGVSFVDARDAAAGMRLAYERGKGGERYLLTACNCTVRTFFGRIARVAGLKSPVWTVPNRRWVKDATQWLGQQARDILGDDDMFPDAVSLDMAYHFWYVSAQKAEDELGWSPREAMVTLSDTVADLRERGLVPLE